MKPKSYTISVENLKQAMITIHVNHLHNIQMKMIDEATEKSDMAEAKAVIQYIMEKK